MKTIILLLVWYELFINSIKNIIVIKKFFTENYWDNSFFNHYSSFVKKEFKKWCLKQEKKTFNFLR